MRGSGRVLCQPSTPIIVAPLRFLDIETSGLRPDRGGRITELALLSENDACISWHSPDGCRVGSASYDAHVKSLLTRFVDASSPAVLVAHNASFDLRFIAYECRRLGVHGMNVQVVDTLALARSLRLTVSDHRLETLATAFDVEVPGPLHTAGVDAQVTRSVFEALVEAGSFETLGQVGLQRFSWSSS